MNFSHDMLLSVAKSIVSAEHDNDGSQWSRLTAPVRYGYIDVARAALTAALPHLPQGVGVKKLEWELVSGDHYAEGAGTHYNIYQTKPDLWNSVTVRPGNVRLATNVDLEAAKAAAQADYEARILSALEPSAARELALEEGYRQGIEAAAQKAAEMLVFADTTSTADREIPAAIRALSSPGHADAGKVEGDGSAAARDVLAERRRQIEAEWWTPEHDNQFVDRELAKAAACYAIDNAAMWPWSMSWWKPSNSRRNLVKAGALILAEIERLDRLPSAPSQEVAGS